MIRRAEVGPRALETDARSLTVRAVISTPAPDRAGDVLLPRGLRNTEEFLRNPVVLWAHQRYTVPPVGRCVGLEVEDDRVVATTKFARGVPFAEEVFRLYEQGVLRAWSVGFVPARGKRRPGAGPNGRDGLLVEEWDLLEYSAVPVPENPQALTLAVEKGGVCDPHLRRWLMDPFAALLA
jgi:HK97 family phage prohead protease